MTLPWDMLAAELSDTMRGGKDSRPGPYLELFARRQRLGWDTWGDEALEHVAL